MTDAPEVHGLCPPAFADVRDTFAQNFTDAPEGLNELAARFSVCVEGEVVVDLWGGAADVAGTRPFTDQTLAPVFSTGKAVMALLIATCVERGLLDYEAPVSDYWPEFGQAGKERITVAQLMSHQSGLSGFATPQHPTVWFEPQAVLDVLCAQAPMWPPGTASGYSPTTIGYLAGELFRRVDGRSMGTALRQDFGEPFDLDLWIGLPEREHDRVAEMKKPTQPVDLGPLTPIKKAAFFDRGSAPGGRGSSAWRKLELPSANLHGTARDLARLLSIVANDGRLEGQAVLSAETLLGLTRQRIFGQDLVLPFVMAWGAGPTRNTGLNVFGNGENAVGHYGWGGSCVLADPGRRASMSYVMTRQSPHLLGDPRAMALIGAAERAL